MFGELEQRQWFIHATVTLQAWILFSNAGWNAQFSTHKVDSPVPPAAYSAHLWGGPKLMMIRVKRVYKAFETLAQSLVVVVFGKDKAPHLWKPCCLCDSPQAWLRN